MTSSDETTEETAVDQTETEQAPVLSGVRVPNVRPGAISGLDHVLLDPSAAAEAEADAPAEREDAPSVDDELERIRGIEDDDERRDAADVLWKRETRDDPAADHSELAEGIRLSVYGEEESAEDIANSDDTRDFDGYTEGENLAWVSEAEDPQERSDRADALWKHTTADSAEGAEENHSGLALTLKGIVDRTIPGELVESETAGTGDAVNAATGEVTPGGENLPPVEQEDGDPLEPVETTEGSEDDNTEGDTKTDDQDGDPETPA